VMLPQEAGSRQGRASAAAMDAEARGGAGCWLLHRLPSPAAQAVDGEQHAHPGVVAGEHLRPEGHVQRARLALPRPAHEQHGLCDRPPEAAGRCRMA